MPSELMIADRRRGSSGSAPVANSIISLPKTASKLAHAHCRTNSTLEKIMCKNLPRITRRRLLAAGVAALAFTVVPAFAAGGAPAVQAKDAWIRWLPGKLPAAGYVSLSNYGDKPVVLDGAASADYGSAALHETRNKGGVSEMVHVDKITIPAHGTLAFKPGGYHIMLMRAKKPIKPGDKVPVTLLFAGGDKLMVNFEVRNPDASGTGGMGGMEMNGMHDMKH
jgi:copper(I)-binding protein